MTDNSWYERGELPPIKTNVDIRCDLLVYGDGESGPVVAHVMGCAVVQMSYGLGCFEPVALHPAKSERDKAIEAAMKIYFRCDSPEEAMSDMYDEGLLKLPEQK